MSVDPGSDRAKWKQVADFVRTQIASGELGPGDFIRSAKQLSQQLGVGVDTVKIAMSELAHEGLVSTDRARGGSWVREKPKLSDLEAVPAAVGARVSARMPSEPERQRLSLELGVPLLVLDRGPGHELETYPSNRVVVVVDAGTRGEAETTS